MRPLQYAIYKGMGGKFGAVQFNFQSPHYFQGRQKDFSGALAMETSPEGMTSMRQGWSIREGAIFVEISSAVGKNQYDWEHKIVMALSVDDMGKMLYSINSMNNLELTHDPGAKTDQQGNVKKFLNLDFVDKDKGGMLKMAKIAGGERVSHTVPLNKPELIILRGLLSSAISRALGW